MAKDNFWKNPAARRGLLRLSDRLSKHTNGIPDAATQLALGELLKSSKTKATLKPAGVKYPSELDLDLLAKINKESLNPFDTGTVADDTYTMFANGWGTIESFKNRLIGMTKYDPELAVVEIEKKNGKVQATCAYAKKWIDNNIKK